jgi:hypothetical protein
MDTRQGTTLIGAICAFIGTLMVIQLWLVSASLEALYSNETRGLLPATVTSAVLCAINIGLFLLGRNFDQKRHRPRIH